MNRISAAYWMIKKKQLFPQTAMELSGRHHLLQHYIYISRFFEIIFLEDGIDPCGPQNVSLSSIIPFRLCCYTPKINISAI